MKTDMQAMVIHHYGKGPVSLERMPLPSMSPYEVRVKIKAASINPIDFKIRDGGLKMLLTYQFPLILGNDFAGEVYEVGDKVTQFKVGTKFMVVHENLKLVHLLNIFRLMQKKSRQCLKDYRMKKRRVYL